MKTFLAVYTGTKQSHQTSGWNDLSEDERKRREQAGMAGWMAWMQEHGPSLAFPGAPLGKTKFVSKKGVADITNNLVGFVVVKAEDYDAAAAMFENHPHFAIFPGDGVEIMECLPIPGM